MALRHEAVQPSTPPTPDGKRTNGRERHLWVSHRHGTATEEQSRRASQALTQSQTNQESHIPTAVKVAAIGVSAPIAAALILDGLHAVDSQIPDAQTAITQALGALSGNGKDQQPAAPPAAATSTAGPSSKDQTPTPTATSAELNQSQVDGIIAQFKSVEPGHQFSADVQQNGAVVTFYDVTNGEHVKVATWGPSAGTINNNLDANTGTITENSTKTTPPTFRFEQGEGATIAMSLLKSQQTTEANGSSNTISTLCPVVLPPGATYTVEYQELPAPAGSPFIKHPALIFKITYPNGGKQIMINPYTETAISTPGLLAFPDGTNPDDQFGTADMAQLYKQNDPRALVYALDNPTNFQRIQTGGVNKVEPGVAAGTFQTTSGTPITAEVVGIGSATPSLFTIDGSVVVIG